jgi:hypothetical protein
MVWVEETTEAQNGVAPTGRDLFYFLVSVGQIPNDQSAYSGLVRESAILRDLGLFPDLDDPTREIEYRERVNTPRSIVALIEEWAGLDLTEDQPYNIIAAVEKRGLVERLRLALTEPLGIPVVPLGGFASRPVRRDVNELIERDDRPALLFAVADFDASGWFIPRVFESKTGPWAKEVTRVALNPEQVARLGIPEFPGKPTDSRMAEFIRETGTDVQVEVNALEVVRPGLLAEMFLKAIAPYRDEDAFTRAKEREAEFKAGLPLDAIERLLEEA